MRRASWRGENWRGGSRRGSAPQRAGRSPGLLRPVDVHGPGAASLSSRGLTSVVGLAGQGLIRFAVLFVIGRYAGPVALGIVATAMATAAVLVLLWPTTCGQAASRFVARARGRGRPAEVTAVADHLNRRFLQAITVLAVAAVPVWLVVVNRADTVAGPTWVAVVGALGVAAYLIGLGGQAYTRGVHYGCGAITRVVVWDLTTSLVGLIGVIVLVATGVADLWLLAPVSGGLLVLTLGCWPWRSARDVTISTPTADTLPGDQRRQLGRELDHFVLFGSLGTLASAGLVQLSLIAARYAGDAAGAGQYAAATALANPLTLLSGAMSLVLYPRMAEAFGRGERQTVAAHLDAGTRGLLALAAPLVAVIVVLSPQLVALIWGASYPDTARILPVILGAVLATMVAVPSVNALTSDDSLPGIRMISLVSVAGLLVAVAGWLVWVPRLGVFGVAVGYAVGAATIAGYALVRQWRAWRMPWTAPATRVALLVAAVALVVTWVPAEASGARVGTAAVLAVGWAALARSDLAVWAVLRPGR